MHHKIWIQSLSDQGPLQALQAWLQILADCPSPCCSFSVCPASFTRHRPAESIYQCEVRHWQSYGSVGWQPCCDLETWDQTQHNSPGCACLSGPGGPIAAGVIPCLDGIVAAVQGSFLVGKPQAKVIKPSSTIKRVETPTAITPMSVRSRGGNSGACHLAYISACVHR